MWRDGKVVSFRARVVERDVIALNNGRAEVNGERYPQGKDFSARALV